MSVIFQAVGAGGRSGVADQIRFVIFKLSLSKKKKKKMKIGSRFKFPQLIVHHFL